jgi:hypothetical protein
VPRLDLLARTRLAFRIWRSFVLVSIGLRREPLPALVARLGSVEPHASPVAPARLGHAVDRSLRLGRRRPRCLVGALVLFHLLREQGDPAELVIGLPPHARDERAHAWVEVAEVDAGPPPGRGAHRPIARYS